MKKNPLYPSYPAHVHSSLRFNEERNELYQKMTVLNADLNICTVDSRAKDKSIQEKFIHLLPDISRESALILQEISANEFFDETLEDKYRRVKLQILYANKYAQLLTHEFSKSCKNYLVKVEAFERRAKYAQKFDVSKIDGLPYDVVRHIYSYLMPETRLQCFSDKIDNLESILQKFTQPYLKKITECGYNLFYDLHYRVQTDRKLKLKKNFQQKDITRMKEYTVKHLFTFNNYAKNKPCQIEKIMKMFRILKDARDCPTNLLTYLLNIQALQMLQMILYLEKQFQINKQKKLQDRRQRRLAEAETAATT